MKRTIKNIIMILMIVALGASAYFTMDYAKNHLTTNSSSIQMQMPGGSSQDGTPPQMPNSDNSDGAMPQPPSGSADDSDSQAQPPEKPEGDSSSTDHQQEQPPEKPNGDNAPPQMANDGNAENQPPAMPSGEMTPPDGDNDNSDTSATVTAPYYAAFAAESLVFTALLAYLIMSGFNKKTFKETLKSGKRITAYVLSVLIITGGLTFAEGEITNRVFLANSNTTQQTEMMPGGQGASVEASGATTVDGTEETLDDTYTSTTSDESPILVTNGGSATISGATVNKDAGDSTSTESSEFTGVNAGILVQENATATIDGATISTASKGANAVFSTGENSKIYISNSTITTTGESSARGLDATYGGYIEADNVHITTQGGSCAALATDRGEGTVIAKNSTLETNGAGSPVIYSTGDISIENTTGTANGAQMAVIEGKNSATVTGSTLTASGAGNRGDVDRAGVMIYQSMSGDAGEGTGTFTATDSSLSVAASSEYYQTAPMFFITNTDAVINLANTKLSFGSGVLISAKGTDEWGTSGSNGGNVTLNAENQTLTGNIEVDKISTAAIQLTASSYEGTINGDNTAKEITLKLDKNSTIKLTGDSYVTSLDDADGTYSNIDFNGYTLYVNGTAINS